MNRIVHRVRSVSRWKIGIVIVIVVIVVAIVIYRRYIVYMMDSGEVTDTVLGKSKVRSNPGTSLRSTCLEGAIYRKGDNICIWGHLNPIPRSHPEIMGTSYNDGFMKIDRHPFLLFKNGSMRIHRHWWSLDDVRYVVQGYNTTPGYYFVQVDRGLHYVSNTDMRLLTAVVYDKLVFYEETPYAIKDGRLYKCPSAMEFVTANFKLHMDHWKTEAINFIGGFDIRFMEIVDVSVASNDELILVIDTGKVLYIPSSRQSDLVNGRYLKDVINRKAKYQNKFKGIKLDLRSNTRSIIGNNQNASWRTLPIHRIILGESSDIFLIFYNHDVALVRNDRIIMRLSGVCDATIDADHVYTVNIDGVLRRYDYGSSNTVDRYDHQTLSHNVSKVFITYDHLTIISSPNIVSKLS